MVLVDQLIASFGSPDEDRSRHSTLEAGATEVAPTPSLRLVHSTLEAGSPEASSTPRSPLPSGAGAPEAAPNSSHLLSSGADVCDAKEREEEYTINDIFSSPEALFEPHFFLQSDAERVMEGHIESEAERAILGIKQTWHIFFDDRPSVAVCISHLNPSEVQLRNLYNETMMQKGEHICIPPSAPCDIKPGGFLMKLFQPGCDVALLPHIAIFNTHNVLHRNMKLYRCRTLESYSLEAYLRPFNFTPQLEQLFHTWAAEQDVHHQAQEDPFAIQRFFLQTLYSTGPPPDALNAGSLAAYGIRGPLQMDPFETASDVFEFLADFVPLFRLVTTQGQNVDRLPARHCTVSRGSRGPIHYWRLESEDMRNREPTLETPAPASSSSSGEAEPAAAAAAAATPGSSSGDDIIDRYYHACTVSSAQSICEAIHPRSAMKDFFIAQAFYVGNSWPATLSWLHTHVIPRAKLTRDKQVAIVVFDVPRRLLNPEKGVHFKKTNSKDKIRENMQGWEKLVHACRTGCREDATPWEDCKWIFGSIARKSDDKSRWVPDPKAFQLALVESSLLDKLHGCIRHVLYCDIKILEEYKTKSSKAHQGAGVA